MFSTIDKMTNIDVDMPNRMFNPRAYVSSNLICGTTVHQNEEEEEEKEALQRKLSVQKTKEQTIAVILLVF